MDIVIDDDTTAALFQALSDPAMIELILSALSASQHDVHPDASAATLAQDGSRLAALVDAGLMTREREGGREIYRLTDPARLELLLRTARQLATDRRAL